MQQSGSLGAQRTHGYPAWRSGVRAMNSSCYHPREMQPGRRKPRIWFRSGIVGRKGPLSITVACGIIYYDYPRPRSMTISSVILSTPPAPTPFEGGTRHGWMATHWLVLGNIDGPHIVVRCARARDVEILGNVGSSLPEEEEGEKNCVYVYARVPLD